MNVIPKGLIEQIQFCETHLPAWAADPAAVGLTAGQVAQLAAETAAARAAFDAAEAAREASKAATLTLNAAAAVMTGRARNLVRVIKSFAPLQSAPDAVYAAAQIPTTARPATPPPPGGAEDIRVHLEPTGAVTLSWQAKDAAASAGAYFTVERRIIGQGGGRFVTVGNAPGATAQGRRMTFTDTTVPAAAAGRGVEYLITGRRGHRTGPASNAITVQFGVGGGEEHAKGDQASRRPGAEIGVRSAA